MDKPVKYYAFLPALPGYPCIAYYYILFCLDCNEGSIAILSFRFLRDNTSSYTVSHLPADLAGTYRFT